MQKSFSAKPKDIKRTWFILDAAQMPLGRLSTIAARLLIGKDKAQFTPHIDIGDFVIVINAQSLQVTGEKAHSKFFYRHSGYPGALYKRTLGEQLQRDPIKVVKRSIRGMLPVNKLRRGRLARLKIYLGNKHEHEAQKPQIFEMKGLK